MREELVETIKKLLRDVTAFSQHAGGVRLRRYQKVVAEAVVDSVVHQRGLTFVVMFPRQSGKNELQAQIEAYLLTLFSQQPAEMVKVSPTWKPQSLNAMRRLERVLARNLVCRDLWKKESGYLYRIGQARIAFLSGAPEANIVGATASLLLEVDEAQDVQIAKFDKDVAPMAASTNATRVFWGTAWTSNTLLARELRAARAAEERDGLRRAFVLDAEQVAAEVPAYGRFVAEQVARLGRSHPLVRTQFFSEEVDAESGMFPPARQALMVGAHPRQSAPSAGKVYAFTLDVGGEELKDEGRGMKDEGRGMKDEGGRRKDEEGVQAGKLAGGGEAGENPARDATALTVFEVDLSTLADELLRAPTYRVVDRRQWVGARHTRLYAELRALAETWRPRYVVVDATGVGAGLASFLEKALPGRVIPFVFNAATKSRLGWEFLAMVETGRFRDWGPGAQGLDRPRDEGWEFWRQVRACQAQVQEGPERRLKWGVPDGTRDAETGDLLHDDLLLSAALAAALDGQDWPLPGGGAAVIRAEDPLKSMDEEGF